MTKRATHKVFIVDDHPLMRKGLDLLLTCEDDFSVAGKASSGTKALEQVPAADPDVVLVDIRMKEMDGFELTRCLRERFNNLCIIVVSNHDTEPFVLRAQKEGADGFVSKRRAYDCLPQLIRHVLEGSGFLVNGHPPSGKTAA